MGALTALVMFTCICLVPKLDAVKDVGITAVVLNTSEPVYLVF